MQPRDARSPPASPNAIGDFSDGRLSEGVLNPFEDLLTPVADEFLKPDTVIHGHHESPADEGDRLGVGGDLGINDLVPEDGDLGLGLATVNPDPLKDSRQQIRKGTSRGGPRAFRLGEVHPAMRRARDGARDRPLSGAGWLVDLQATPPVRPLAPNRSSRTGPTREGSRSCGQPESLRPEHLNAQHGQRHRQASARKRPALRST